MRSLIPRKNSRAEIKTYVQLGERAGDLDGFAQRHSNFENIRGFSFSKSFSRGSRGLIRHTSGVIAFNLMEAGNDGSLAIVKLPDAIEPDSQTLHFLDTSEKSFGDITEDEFCLRAVAEASYVYLALANQLKNADKPFERTAESNGAGIQPAFHGRLPGLAGPIEQAA